MRFSIYNIIKYLNFLASKCVANKYYNDYTDNCLDCHPRCNACVGPSENDCTSCLPNEYMLAPSENAIPFRCVTTCNHTSKELPEKYYKFCQIESAVDKIDMKFDDLQFDYYAIINSIIILIFIIIGVCNLAVMYYYRLKTKPISKDMDNEVIPLFITGETELQKLSMSDINWGSRKKIREGRFGHLYKCFSETLNKHVAVKELISRETPSYTTFFQEMEKMSFLSHPNVTRILGFDAKSGLKIITYLRTDLTKHLTKLSKPEKGILIRFCVQITDAIIYLHARNIIHGDLTANNVLVKDEFTVEVANFGLIGIVGSGNKDPDTLTHTPLEYLTGEAKHPTKEGDVWSFGVTAWEIFTLCKEKPYSEEEIHSPAKMMNVLLNGRRLSRPPLLHEHPALWGSILNCKSFYVYSNN